MIKKKILQKSALLLAAALSISALSFTKTNAALLVDTAQLCSVQIQVPASGFSELSGLEIPVDLYKVADIDETGAYTLTGTFSGKRAELKDEKGAVTAEVKMDDLEAVSSKTTAEEWMNFALAVKQTIEETSAAKDASVTIKDGSGTIADLPVGLYLIDAQPVNSAVYAYKFQPYLISLPNNYYASSGDDTWVYELTGEHAVGLKPEKEDLYGDLVINKTVDVFDGTYDEATFVFQVEAYKKDPDAPEGTEPEKVFSDVFALEFTGPGTKSLTVGPIPAGAEVTVTEVYTGASYSVDQETKTAVILADEVLADNPELSKATVGFTNTHDGHTRGGNGIVNTFSYKDGQWIYTAASESVSKTSVTE